MRSELLCSRCRSGAGSRERRKIAHGGYRQFHRADVIGQKVMHAYAQKVVPFHWNADLLPVLKLWFVAGAMH